MIKWAELMVFVEQSEEVQKLEKCKLHLLLFTKKSVSMTEEIVLN